MLGLDSDRNNPNGGGAFVYNWSGIEIRSSEPRGVWKCCVEGHILIVDFDNSA